MEGFLVFFLIFMRILSFMIASPLFSIKGIPSLLKIGLSIILSYLLFMVIGDSVSISSESLIAYGIMIVNEVLFGLALGFAVNLIFICIQMAGQMIDFQIGFSMAATFDPLTNNKVSLFGNMYYWVGIALFFAVNGHYYLIYSLAQSFELVPLNSLTFYELNAGAIIDLFSGGFLIAFQIAVPTIIILLLMDAIMGLLARTVPQLNILMLGLPLKVLVGLLSTIVLLPALGNMMVYVIESLPYRINDLLNIIPFIFLFAADEKTEQPTPKKLDDARKKGQVAKSTDLNSAIILLLLVILISTLGNFIFSNIYLFLQNSLGNGLNINITQGNISQFILEHILAFFKITIPILGGVMVVGVLTNLLQIGFIRSLHPLKPDIKRLNPIEGFKRIFSKKSLFELTKNLLKLVVVGFIAYSFINDNLKNIFSTTQMSIQGYFPFFKEIVLGLMLRIGVVMLILSIIDYIYQRYEFKKNLRMTKHEIKEEMKQMEGDPQIKSLRKQKQRQLAMKRMMAEVPNSTVIITNPTHLAIAIKYDEKTIGAPIVLAKGADYVAERIREIAKQEKIPIIENKPLARVLYKEVDVGQEVPMELYQAVAEILAIVYRMENKSKFV
jgi:flagellar biosynthetic protein FliR/FlhB